MPHLIVEYTDNLADTLDIMGLLTQLHDTAIETGVFPRKGARTRAIKHDAYVVADKRPQNAFIHVVARIGTGRDADTKQAAGDAIFKALTDFTDALYASKPLALSFEFVEISTWKKNNLANPPV